MNRLSLLFLPVICLLLNIQPTIAQNPADNYLFNKVFPVDTSGQLCNALIQHNNQFIITGPCTHSGGQSFYMRVLDQQGNELWNKLLATYPVANTSFGNAVINTEDGNFLLLGNSGQGNGSSHLTAIKFDEWGEILWTKSYDNGDDHAIYENAINTLDHGYLFACTTADNLGTNSIYAVKTDSLGVVEWERTYGVSRIVLHAEQCANGDFLFSGYIRTDSTDVDMLILRTNPQGEPIWQKTIGTPMRDGGCTAVEQASGRIIVRGLIHGGYNEFAEIKKTYVAILEPNTGNILEDRLYSKNNILGPSGPGLEDEYGNRYSVLYSYGPIPIWEVYLVKYSAIGDTLWTKRIQSGLSGEDYIRDMERTPDGGFVFAGFNYTNQQAWVLKTDSLGNACGDANCVTPIYATATQEFATPLLSMDFSLVPNPAASEVRVTWAGNNIGTIELYDLVGKCWLRQTVANSATISIATLPKGLYMCRLYQNGKPIASTKLIIEH